MIASDGTSRTPQMVCALDFFMSLVSSSARKHAIKEFFRTLPSEERKKKHENFAMRKLALKAESSRLGCNLFVTVETFHNRIWNLSCIFFFFFFSFDISFLHRLDSSRESHRFEKIYFSIDSCFVSKFIRFRAVVLFPNSVSIQSIVTIFFSRIIL